MILAVPRLTASIALLPGEAALALIEANDAPTRTGSLRAVSAQEAALSIMPDPRPHLNEGLIALSMVEAGAAETDDQTMRAASLTHRLARVFIADHPRGKLRLRMRFQIQFETASLHLASTATEHGQE